MQLPNKVFDWLKWIAIIALPALSTFIVVISKIRNWADLGSMIAQTITAVAVLLGALLGVSSVNYKGDESDDA
jgi:branched-subunit amino acid transport protein